MNWELIGCGAVFVLLVLGALLAGTWLDDQGDLEDWWGNQE